MGTSSRTNTCHVLDHLHVKVSSLEIELVVILRLSHEINYYTYKVQCRPPGFTGGLLLPGLFENCTEQCTLFIGSKDCF